MNAISSYINCFQVTFVADTYLLSIPEFFIVYDINSTKYKNIFKGYRLNNLALIHIRRIETLGLYSS